MTIELDTDEFDSLELLALARVALERNDVEGALRKLKRVLGESDPPADAVGLAARVYAQLGLYERAERLYERFLEAHPDAVLEKFQLGMTRFDAGRYDDALQVWEGVLAEQPEHPPARFYKALVLLELGKHAEATEILNRLLKTIGADNLYFARSKELLQAVEARSGPGAPVETGGNGRAHARRLTVPSDPYRTEH